MNKCSFRGFLITSCRSAPAFILTCLITEAETEAGTKAAPPPSHRIVLPRIMSGIRRDALWLCELDEPQVALQITALLKVSSASCFSSLNAAAWEKVWSWK